MEKTRAFSNLQNEMCSLTNNSCLERQMVIIEVKLKAHSFTLDEVYQGHRLS